MHDDPLPRGLTEGPGELAALPAAPEAPYTASAVFTGQGSEYFRIWVVNLLLTLVTLGVYSAWAKVRTARYFRNNTRLDGHVFDYHGSPAAILRGRILALLLLAAYSWAFQFSNVAGLLTIAILCAAGPWLFMRAQQFSLSNTSFRGVRFGFRAQAGEAYRTVLPVLVVWLSPTVAAGLSIDEGWLLWGPALAATCAVPWMHHRLKAYQRRNAVYGDREFAFRSALLSVCGVYAKGLGLVLIGVVLAGGTLVALFAWQSGHPWTRMSEGMQAMIYGLVAGLLVYIVAWPYLAARLQQVIWSRTRLGDMSFRTEIAARPLFRLVFRNVFLTLLTGGVYWPWAAIALARYRIECVRVESPIRLSVLTAGVDARPVSAAGEGAADAFGFDIGL